MWTIAYSGSFNKDLKRIKKRGYDMQLLRDALAELEQTGTLPPKYRPHILTGRRYAGFWEAHLQPDWLIVWNRRETEVTLVLMYTGTHSDLF